MFQLRIPMGPLVYSRRLGGKPTGRGSFGKSVLLLIASPFLLIAVLTVIWLAWELRWVLLATVCIVGTVALVRASRARGAGQE